MPSGDSLSTSDWPRSCEAGMSALVGMFPLQPGPSKQPLAFGCSLLLWLLLSCCSAKAKFCQALGGLEALGLLGGVEQRCSTADAVLSQEVTRNIPVEALRTCLGADRHRGT